MPGAEFKFNVSNVHKMVHPCTLPQRLPTDILRPMLSEFKEQLMELILSVQASMCSPTAPGPDDPFNRGHDEYCEFVITHMGLI
jgi:hypothetical protein